MSKSFAITITYSYLCELGIDADTALELAERDTSPINKFLETACDTLFKRLELTNSKDENDVLNHKKNWKYRHDLYKNICDYFFGYGYSRHWVYKPMYESPFALNINNNIFDGTPRLSECLTSIFPSSLHGFDSDFLNHLDTQAMQCLYVYCFENGLNLGFY